METDNPQDQEHKDTYVGNKLFRVRLYQQELFEEARKRNVVAFLDTGAGKTMISVLLIKDKAEQLSIPGQKKITVFLAPKVDLVLQQASVLRDHTGMEVGGYVGSMGVDFWKAKEWKQQMQKQQVMVMTHQILLNSLRHGFLEMQRINLLVFDECHHAKKNHPYNCIMREFYFRLPKDRQPHIFGMTASPLDTKLGRNQAEIGTFFETLEQNLDCKVLTVADRTLLEQVAPLPSSEILEYTTPVLSSPLAAALERMTTLSTELRVQGDLARSARQKEALQLQGLGKMKLVFDVEKLRTECHVFARHISNIIYIVQDMGPFAGALCLLEVLKPVAKKLYNTRLNGRLQQAASQAAAQMVDSDLELENHYEDAWWDGHIVRYSTTSKHHCTPEETLALNSAMWSVVAEFQTLVAPSALATYKPLTGEQAVSMRWPEICQRLQDSLHVILAAADWPALGRQLIEGPQQKQENEPELVTAKVSKLCQLLLVGKELAQEHEQNQADSNVKKWSCIVFCKRKLTVLALNWLVTHCGPLEFIHSASIMGSGGREAAGPALLKKQQKVLAEFKAGVLNTLIATSVAEEGLDLTHCRLVVRYDLPATPLEFIQSRGRARARGSRMVLMVEQGNDQQIALLTDVHGCEENMRAEAIRRRLRDGDSDIESEAEGSQNGLDEEGRQADEDCYIVPSTNARVTRSSAKGLLFHYCSKLPSDKYTQLQPRFSTVNPEPMQFRTTVILPNNCPVQQVAGELKCKKVWAIGSACLTAVEVIHKAGGFTDWLLPDVGIQQQNRDVFAEFDECRVAAVQKDPDMPSRAQLTSKVPDILSWPKPAADNLALGEGNLAMHLYRVKLSTKLPELVPRSVASKLPELDQQFGLLVPKALPPLPQIPLELLPGVITRFDLCHVSQLEVPVHDYQAAKAWHELVLLRESEGTLKRKGTTLEGKDGEPKAKKARKAKRDKPTLDSPKAQNTGTSAAPGLCDKAEEKAGALSHGAIPEGAEAGEIAKQVKEPETKQGAIPSATCIDLPADGPAQHMTGDTRTQTAENPSRPPGQQPGKNAASTADGPAAQSAVPDPESTVMQDAAEAAVKNLREAALKSHGEAAFDTPAEALTDLAVPLPGEAGAVDLAPALESEDMAPESLAKPGLKGVHIDVTKKAKGEDHDDQPAWYCLVPLLDAAEGKLTNEIDWPSIRRIYSHQTAKEIIRECIEHGKDVKTLFEGCLVTTTHNHMTYDVLGVEESMSLDSIMPDIASRLCTTAEETDKSKHDGGEKMQGAELEEPRQTFREYYRTRWNVNNLEDTSIMLQCTSKSLLRRGEAMAGRELAYGEITALLPPQLCLMHALKRQATLSCKHLPDILWWIHTLLLSVELRSKISPDTCPLPDVKLIAEAITPSHCQQDLSYERLETLGDAFLKYDCCTHVFFTYPNAHEGQMAESKQSVISNQNLGVLGHLMGLARFTGLPTSKIDWATGERTEKQKVTHKVVADCMEALIGAHYIAGGERGASDYMRHIGLLPQMPKTARLIPGPDRKADSPSARKLEALIGYRFRDLKLLKEACTHCSWPDQSAPCYQRLEFLGDAALDFLISRYYILGYRDIEPGKLHDLRSASVNNTRLAIITAWYRLHPFLRYCSTRLFGEIAAFVGSVKDAKKGKLPPQLKSRTHSWRMEQLSSRDYKNKGGILKFQLNTSTWASEDPSNTVFPPSYWRQVGTDKRRELGEKDSLPEHRSKRRRDQGPKDRHRSSEYRDRQEGHHSRQVRSRTDGYSGDAESCGLAERQRESAGPPAFPNPQSDKRPSSRSHEPPHRRPSPVPAHHRVTSSKDQYRGSRESRRHSSDARGWGFTSHSNQDQDRDRDGRRHSGADRGHMPHNSHPRGLDPSSDGQNGQKDTLDLFISAGFGQGFAAAPKALGDLFESITGAIFIDSGGDLDVLWRVIHPFLQPMVHPDNVPCHPVRAILELAQKAGLQASFRREECQEEGCYSMATLVNGKIIGLCKSAVTRDYARLLCAEEALENWNAPLIKELQALPQQAPGKPAAPKRGPAKRKEWGLQISTKLGPQLLATTMTLKPDAIKPKPIPGTASHQIPAVADSADLPETRQANALEPDAIKLKPTPGTALFQSPAVVDRAELTENRAANALEHDTIKPKPTAGPASHQVPAVKDRADLPKTQQANEQAPATSSGMVAAVSSAPPKKAKLKIPKEWLNKMQNL